MMERTPWQNPWVRAVTTVLTLAVMVMIFCFSMENAEKSDRRSGVLSGSVIPHEWIPAKLPLYFYADQV